MLDRKGRCSTINHNNSSIQLEEIQASYCETNSLPQLQCNDQCQPSESSLPEITAEEKLSATNCCPVSNEGNDRNSHSIFIPDTNKELSTVEDSEDVTFDDQVLHEDNSAELISNTAITNFKESPEISEQLKPTKDTQQQNIPLQEATQLLSMKTLQSIHQLIPKHNLKRTREINEQGQIPIQQLTLHSNQITKLTNLNLEQSMPNRKKITNTKPTTMVQLPDGRKFKVVKYVPPEKNTDSNDNSDSQIQSVETTTVKNDPVQKKYSIKLRCPATPDTGEVSKKWLTKEEKERKKEYKMRYLSSFREVQEEKEMGSKDQGQDIWRRKPI